MGRPVSLPQREDPVLQRQRRGGLLLLLRLPASGDAITFVRETEHLDFVDAVRRLADRAGITLHEDAAGGRDSSAAPPLARCHRARHRVVPRAAAHRRPTPVRPGTTCAAGATTARWSGGSALGGPPTSGMPCAWGLVSTRSWPRARPVSASSIGAGRLQDAFRARILFPICDPSGHPVALGGRVLPGSADPAKYKNSAETAIYSKRRTLYALNWAKQDVVATGEVVVCEGYTDVIGFFEAGVERAVATCGTALGEEHVDAAAQLRPRVVLAFDADGAGQSAAEPLLRVGATLRDRRGRGRPAARVRPGELARSDPAALRAAVEGAKPFLQFRVDSVLDARRPVDRRGPGQGGRTRPRIVAEHPDDLVRDQYVMQVAERCHLEPEPATGAARRAPPRGPRDRRAVTARDRLRRSPAVGGGDRGCDRRMGADGATGAGRRSADRAAASGRHGRAGAVRPPSSVPASRPSGWPSTDPRRSTVGSRRRSSATSCQRAAFRPLSMPRRRSAKRSTARRPSRGPCLSAWPWRSPGASRRGGPPAGAGRRPAKSSRLDSRGPHIAAGRRGGQAASSPGCTR